MRPSSKNPEAQLANSRGNLSTPLHIFSRSDLTSALPTFNLTSNLYGFTSKKNATVVGVAPRSR